MLKARLATAIVPILFVLLALERPLKSQTVFVPAGGLSPLELIQFTGIQIQTGDTLQFSATGLANGCPGHSGCILRDANGAPAGSQQFSGPVSGNNFQIVTDGVANIYSLVGAISNASNNALLQSSQWFSIGTSRQIVADRTGELVLALENAVYNGATGISGGEGGFTVTITNETGGCSYSVAPSSRSFGPPGGFGDVVVTTSPGCPWNAVSNASWITSAARVSSGAGIVNYDVAANSTGGARTGTISIAGSTFAVNQAGSNTCTYVITPVSQTFALAGGTSTVTVTAPSGCFWTVVNNISWITILSGSSGTGNGSVMIRAALNSDGPRSGNLVIAGDPLKVTQSGTACGATDVSDKIVVSATALQGAPPLFNFDSSKVTLSNNSGQPIPGPIYLVMDGLPRFDSQFCPFGCGLSPGWPLTFCQSPNGSYLVQFSPSTLGAGQSVALTLLFAPGIGSGSTNQRFSYTTRVFSGTPSQ